MPSKRSNVWIVSLSILVAITFGGIHLASISVTEVTKDTFEAFSLDARLIPIELQHRLMFSLLGWVLALSGGYLAREYFYAQGGLAYRKQRSLTCAYGLYFLAHSRFQAQFFTTLLSPVEK